MGLRRVPTRPHAMEFGSAEGIGLDGLSLDKGEAKTLERKEKEKSNRAATLALILVAFLLLSSLPYFDHHFVNAQTGAVIDLFTDQAPFNGIGANQSSDAYEPQDLVNLSALATYNGGPERNMPVAFEVNGPPNAFENVSIVGSATTNDGGVGTFSFRIPWPNVNAEEIIFGKWSAIATIDIAGKVVVDTLTFQVGWIIRITDLSTLDFQSKIQTAFVRQDLVVFNMTVENIARTNKSATIKVDVEDSRKNPIIHIEMENMIFPPGKSSVQTSSRIPISADVGLANVSAAPFTAPPEMGGRLYSPAIFTAFTIGETDIAITGVTLSRTSVYAGDTVGIYVDLLNKGSHAETFNVSVFYDEALIGTQQVTGLAPSANETVSFVWITNSVKPSSYRITASAPLPGDVTPSDNTFVDGTVTILSKSPSLPSEWLFFFAIVLIAGIAGVILLFLIFALDRVRRRRPRPAYTVIAHPHI